MENYVWSAIYRLHELKKGISNLFDIYNFGFSFDLSKVYFEFFTHRRLRRSIEGMCFLIILISRFIPHPPQTLKMRLPGRPNFLLSLRVETATSWVKRSIFRVKKATRQITVDESSRLGCFWGVFENFKEIVQRIPFVQFATEEIINLKSCDSSYQ